MYVDAVHEWNCNDCDNQANNVSNLIIHLKVSGHPHSKNIENNKSTSLLKCVIWKNKFSRNNLLVKLYSYK